jgi:hypothetical protein
MFGFSFAKLLLVAAVIAAVWYGYRWWQRVQKVTRDEGATLARERARAAEGEVMIKCSSCETYVSPKAARSCGRAECPYPG